jgi:hypothetical protein
LLISDSGGGRPRLFPELGDEFPSLVDASCDGIPTVGIVDGALDDEFARAVRDDRRV